MLTEHQKDKLSKAFIAFLAFIIVGGLVAYVVYTNQLMLKSILDKNKRMECAITMPNVNGIDMNPDAVE